MAARNISSCFLHLSGYRDPGRTAEVGNELACLPNGLSEGWLELRSLDRGVTGWLALQPNSVENRLVPERLQLVMGRLGGSISVQTWMSAAAPVMTAALPSEQRHAQRLVD
jgi:hypothetical protein